MRKLLIILMSCVVFSGCTANMRMHLNEKCVGTKEADLLKKFGPPMRVEPSVGNAETWVYGVGSGAMTYTMQDKICIRKDSRSAP